MFEAYAETSIINVFIMNVTRGKFRFLEKTNSLKEGDVYEHTSQSL